MEPTLLAGEQFSVRQFQGDPTGQITRGELIVHSWPPDPSKRFVKRVVGLPGDTLGMVRGTLHVNGRAIPESYARIEDPTSDPVSDDFVWQRSYVLRSVVPDTTRYVASRDNWGPLVVPPRMFFVLGDNRDNSLDSRYWGFLPSDHLIGEARRIYLSRDAEGRVRWDRLGRRLP